MESQNKAQMPTKKNYYALIALMVSIVLGFSYIYLFLWKDIGISHLLYYILAFVLAVVPVFIVDQEKGPRRFSNWLVLLPVSLLLSTVFIYRLNQGWITWAFLTLPVLYGFLLRSVFIPDTAKNFSIFSFVALPVLFIVSWFADIVKFFRNFKLRVIKTKGFTTKLKKVLWGILVAIPFLVFFGILLSSADMKFGEALSDLVEQVFGDWFTDDLIGNLGKLIIGGIVSIYSMIYYFSLWNPDSHLARVMKMNLKREKREVKKKWDSISTSVFLFMLNILFVSFVAVQFKYMFGGDDNVFKDEGYTYSEYARKGFFELTVVAVSAYLMMLVINSKVLVKSIQERAIFRFNYFLLSACILVVTYSAFARIALYQQIYGYTGLRLFATSGIIAFSILYVMLILSTFLKKPLQFTNLVVCVLAVAFYAFWIMIPQDWIVAKLNYIRYQNTDKLDVPYLFRLSDEAVPVLIQMTEDNKVTEDLKILIYSELEDRWESYENGRDKWQSWNFVYEYNRQKLGEIKEGAWRQKAREGLESFLNDYERVILSGQFELAYNDYWTEHSIPQDFSELNDYTLIEYSFEDINEYDDWSILSKSEGEYWMGMNISADVKYSYFQDPGLCDEQFLGNKGMMCIEFADYCNLDQETNLGDDKELPVEGIDIPVDENSMVYFSYNESTNTYTKLSTSDKSLACRINIIEERRDRVRVVLENGEWRIKDSSLFTLGLFRDGNQGRILDKNSYFEQNEGFYHLKD